MVTRKLRQRTLIVPDLTGKIDSSLLLYKGDMIYASGVATAARLARSANEEYFLGCTIDAGEIIPLWQALPAFLLNVSQDTSPSLGGDLDCNGHEIDNLKLSNLSAAPTAAVGKIYFDTDDLVPVFCQTTVGPVWKKLFVDPTTSGGDLIYRDIVTGTTKLTIGTEEQILGAAPDGFGGVKPAWITFPGLLNVVDDTTPQLGGDLDLHGHNIDFPTTANISDCLDEDTMASDSATKLCTQQSIKAYADTKMAKACSTANVTASRAIDGTVYHNTSGCPMCVVIDVDLDAGGRFISCSIGATSTPADDVGGISTNIDLGVGSKVFWVPSGYYYKVINSGPPTLYHWQETTIGG